MNEVNITIDLDATKGYPLLSSFSGSVFSFLNNKDVQPGENISYNRHVYTVKDVLERRESKGWVPEGVMYYSVNVTLIGRIEKNKHDVKIFIPA